MNNRIYTERADLFDPNMYITIFFDITGDVNTDRLVRSINKAFASFEATMSRIVLTNRGEAYYESMPVSGCKVELTALDCHKLLTENEQLPFAFEKGEMLRVFIHPVDGKTRVFIMAHHLVGDGKSIVYFIERFMNEYVGETSDFQPLQLLTDKSFPSKSKLPFLTKLWVKNSFNKPWIKSGKVFDFNDYYNLYHTYWKDRQSVVLSESFPPSKVNAIHQKASDAGVSINSFIITAFFKSDKKLKSVGIAINARFDENRTMSNQASGISVNYCYNDKFTFEQNAKQVHKRIYKKLSKPLNKYFILRFIALFNPSLIDSVLMHTNGLYENVVTKKLTNVLGYSGEGRTSFGITNLTRLDISSTYNDIRIENLFFVPPVVSYSRHTIGIATIESGMTVTYHCMNDIFNERRKAIFENAMNILHTV